MSAQVLQRFVLAEGQGEEQVRAIAEELRGSAEAEVTLVIDRLEQIALIIAERYVPLAARRGELETQIDFQMLGRELEELGRTFPHGSVEWCYALHNAATCWSSVNGGQPFDQGRLNDEVARMLRLQDTSVLGHSAESLLLRKVEAGLHEAEQGNITAMHYAQVVFFMAKRLDPDACGRVEFLLRRFRTEEKRDSERGLLSALPNIRENEEHFKPQQFARLEHYLQEIGA